MRHAVRRGGRRALVVLALAGLGAMAAAPPVQAQPSFAPDRSDQYASANEPGWSLQFAQQGESAFATLLVFDAGGQPTYFTATLTQADPAAAWAGDLYRTTGSYFGAVPYSPSAASAAKVGTMTLRPTSFDMATLQYSVDGTTVTKSVARQSLQNDNYSGTYAATVYVVASHCSASEDNGARVGSYVVTIDQKGTAITVTGAFAKRGTSTCTYTGTYLQVGRTGAVGTSYTCSDGDEGSMSFFELTRRPGMFAGWIQGHSITDSCDYNGTMTGLVPL